MRSGERMSSCIRQGFGVTCLREITAWQPGGLWPKPDVRLWRLGRWWRRIEDLHDLAQDLHDCRLMHVQSGGELFLQGSEFPCELGSAAKGLAHFRKSTNNKNAHLNSACAVQNVGSHQRAVFGESVRQIFYVF